MWQALGIAHVEHCIHYAVLKLVSSKVSAVASFPQKVLIDGIEFKNQHTRISKGRGGNRKGNKPF